MRTGGKKDGSRRKVQQGKMPGGTNASMEEVSCRRKGEDR